MTIPSPPIHRTMKQNHLTPHTVECLRAVLIEADILRYTREDNDPLLRDLHRYIRLLRAELPEFDIHPGHPSNKDRRST